MLKLYGFSVSNYYNVVKAALLEKGMDFQEVRVTPGADAALLARSPMGKVPCLETAEGSISESQVILEYLEELQPQPALMPPGPFARAKARELNRVLELYLELPARRLYPQAFFGGAVSDETKTQVRGELTKAVHALTRLTDFQPWIAGDSFTSSDLVAAIHLPLVRDAARKVLDWDPYPALSGVRAYLERVRQRPSMQRVLADYKAELGSFLQAKRG